MIDDQWNRATEVSWTAYLLFALTGTALVLPGTLMPLFAQRWSGDDGRSSCCFFLFFLGTSFGALLARGALDRLLLIATVLSSVSLASLAWSTGDEIYLALFCFGVGLGITMTALSIAQGQWHPQKRLRELTRLNLFWAVGACCGPLLLLRTAYASGIKGIVSAVALSLLLAGVAAAHAAQGQRLESGQRLKVLNLFRVPVLFATSIALCTGIEASVGAWLSTYTSREEHGDGAVTFVVTAMWSGLFLARLLCSGNWFSLNRLRRTPITFCCLVVLGHVVLIASSSTPAAIVGAFCIGFGIGPLYPFVLSRLLERSTEANAGFLAASVGAILLPLLVGQVSVHSRSIVSGLLVPLVGGLILLIAVVRITHDANDANPFSRKRR